MRSVARHVALQPRSAGGLLMLVAALLCAACGTFQLASGIRAPAGRSSDQQQLDILFCKDQAKLEAGSTGRHAGAFFLGMTVVGSLVAYELEKSTQRDVFARCLTARGYTVLPAEDEPRPEGAVGSQEPVTAPDADAPPAVKPAPSKLSLTLPAGWTPLPLPPALSSAEAILYATNRTIDAGAFLAATKREGITDLETYARARRASQASALHDPQQSELLPVDLAGKRGFRFTVAGAVKSGLRITYLLTIIEGDTEIAVLNAWTSTANFDSQRSAMELLAAHVTGL